MFMRCTIIKVLSISTSIKLNLFWPTSLFLYAAEDHKQTYVLMSKKCIFKHYRKVKIINNL